ncbi:reductive dehalogenase [Arenicella xantha]|uniref:Reductive dehalogenase n=1 Tax=Arenicella xantha TaxID=644221 RepID=A0A395JVF3_9GAMM|nr:reductive dehalogenase [Arenicella xantha]RBP53548.1 reductive dehalogenase [Arenicella xantha]
MADMKTADEFNPDNLKPTKNFAPTQNEALCGFENITITPEFEPFNQPNDMFCRGFWDKKVQNKMVYKFFRSFVKPTERSRDADGYEAHDYALRNGPWVVTEMLAERHKTEDRRDGFWDNFKPHIPPKLDPVSIEDPVQASVEIKKVAKLYGADLVGITDYEERLNYVGKFSARTLSNEPLELPEGLTNVVVLAKAMDYELIRTSPSSTASTAPAIGYADDAVILLAVAQYIRSLGYQAVACQNDTNLAIPYAIKAGLGEYGRSGIVITKEFGPRVRFGRVLTDMPLQTDKPQRFGVTETCQICRRCANNCPPQAIDHGEPSDYTFNRSNIKGIVKWTTDAEKCFKFWVSKGTDCANCIRTCVYNKDFSQRRFRVLRWLLGTPLRKLALKIDDRLRLHDQLPSHLWWGRKAGLKDIKIEVASDHPIDPEKAQRQQRVKDLRANTKERSQAEPVTP